MGQLYLGHYVGSLQQRVMLQHDYEQTILVADLQGLTDNGHNPHKVSSNILNVVANYLAVGIAPLIMTICLQSAIPALSELTMYKQISKAVKSMYTHPHHLTVEQPGHVENNVVFTYSDAFHPDSAYIEQLKLKYREGGLSDGKTKKILEECLQDILKAIRERRELFISDKSLLLEILRTGY